MDPKIYPYLSKLWVGAAASGFFILCAVILAEQALHNDRGLLLDRIISLDPQSATIFYWVLAGAGVVLAMLGLWGLTARLRAPRRVQLLADRLTVPKNGFAATDTEVPYGSIIAARITSIGLQRFLTVQHSGGKLSIPQTMMPSKAAFEEMAATVADRMRSSQHQR